MDLIDTEKKTYFEIIFLEKYKTKCDLRRQESIKFLVFYNINESITKEEYSLNFNEYHLNDNFKSI